MTLRRVAFVSLIKRVAESRAATAKGPVFFALEMPPQKPRARAGDTMLRSPHPVRLECRALCTADSQEELVDFRQGSR